MLPFDNRGGMRFGGSSSSSSSSYSLDTRFPDYARRLLDWSQMDFEATFDQMLALLSADPSTANKHFFQRKQTKDQWARDDPAFVVLEGAFVLVASLAYAIALEPFSVWGYLWSCFYNLVINWLLLGCIISSLCCHVSNRFLREHHGNTMEQEVEWLFAFDVHSNAFFCSFLITYVLQYFLLPIVMGTNFLSCLLANALYASGAIWYAYNTYQGYNALPFISNPQVFFWYPSVATVAALGLTFVLLLLGLHFNASRLVMSYHYS